MRRARFDLEVRVDGLPVSYCGDDTHRDDFVAHLHEVLIALLESSLFLFATLALVAVVYTILIDDGLHTHDDVVEARDVHVAASRPAEGSTTHSSTDHLDGDVCRALEGRATTELDDVGTTLGDALLDVFPRFGG